MSALQPEPCCWSSCHHVRKRWSLLFSDDSIGVDLRQSIKDGDGFNPCEEGLRSVCWKAFLLYGPPSRASWPKKLAESRSAYTSLRDHFLRYIDHPDDLQSAVDPLADDDNVRTFSSAHLAYLTSDKSKVPVVLLEAR